MVRGTASTAMRMTKPVNHGRLPSVTPRELTAVGGWFSGVGLSLHPQSETSNVFLEMVVGFSKVASWSFLTSHARALLCIARDPGRAVTLSGSNTR